MKPVRSSPRNSCRRGAVTVEFALTVPIFFLVLFGSIELARLNMLRTSIENAAYEGARRAIVPGGTAADAQDGARVILTAVSARHAQVDVDPPIIDADTTQVTVTVAVPLRKNLWVFAPAFTGTSDMVRSCTLSVERTNLAPR
jgi:Flp pilus assembly protein TadG